MKTCGLYEVREHGVKQCNYCGSLHPEDAVKFLKQAGTTFSGSDWKYGWPHKFYISPVNPDAEAIIEMGSRSHRQDGGGKVDGSQPTDRWSCRAHGHRECTCPKESATGYWYEPIMGKRTHLSYKFYNQHLQDATPEVFAEFAVLSQKIFGISWERDEKGVKYSSPKRGGFYGFQRAGEINQSGDPVHTL
jgi:hypothetical protein